MKHVARRAGVSVATVSRVINNKDGDIPISKKTKEKVLRVVKDLNYQPNIMAKRLVTQKSYVIGVVINWYEILSGGVNAMLLQGVGDVLDASGYSMELITAMKKKDIDEFLIRMIRSRHIDGLVIWSDKVGSKFVETAKDEDFPFCYLQVYPPTRDCPGVFCDNIQGGYNATSHLLSQGHRSIMAIVGTNTQEGGYRLEGYKRALRDYDVEFNDNLVVDAKFTRHADPDNINLSQFYSSLPECTAVFATSDLLAIVVMNLLREKGMLIPRDVALVGFDGLDITTYVAPTLSTVKQNAYSMGKKAAKTLMMLLDGKEQSTWEFVPTELLVRESSKEGK
jgi:LacI family transcriptional regulator